MDDWQSTIQDARPYKMALLLLILGIGLFSLYRARLGAAVQHAAIWVLIFGGVIVLYGFREVLLSELNPSTAQVRDAETLVLARAQDGHFRARVTVEGVPVEMLVDTGATRIVLSRADATRLGLAPEVYDLRVRTANGVVRAASVRLDSVRLGTFEDRNVAAMVTSSPLDISLLGMGYLDRFASVTFAGDRLILKR